MGPPSHGAHGLVPEHQDLRPVTDRWHRGPRAPAFARLVRMAEPGSRPPERKWWSLRRLSADPAHGPLPALLLVLTVVTGVVDAVSILSLGRVFVANMTGNVVFVGFALSGAAGFSLSASLFAIGGFLVGAFGGGALIERMGENRAVLLRNTVAGELLLLLVAVAVASPFNMPFSNPVKDSVAAVTAIAMGAQNSTARRLAVPDLTTTVLTMTLTGLAADLRSHNGAVILRRVLAVTTMLVGAAAGAVLVIHVRPVAALGLAAALLAVVLVLSAVASKRPAEWQGRAR
jgi:uncharacterized membrane protein YoaK (UPF0700 family)